jgi:type I restriction enzyme S subunit
LREQDRIVAEIDRSLSIAEATHDAVTSSVVKTSRVRQSVLKWAFEGRLVDQDPTDEPASRLLERIQDERESSNGSPRRTRARSPKA